MTKEDNDQDVESDPMINDNLHSSNHNSCDNHHCHHEIITTTRMMVKQLRKKRRRRIALILIQQCMLWSWSLAMKRLVPLRFDLIDFNWREIIVQCIELTKILPRLMRRSKIFTNGLLAPSMRLTDRKVSDQSILCYFKYERLCSNSHAGFDSLNGFKGIRNQIDEVIKNLLDESKDDCDEDCQKKLNKIVKRNLRGVRDWSGGEKG